MAKRTARKVKAAVQRAPARGREDRLPLQYNVREARKNLGKIMDQVVESGSAALLGRRESTDLLLLPFERFEFLLSGDLRARLAFLIVDTLLGDAPWHLRKPQIEELAGLPREDLLALLTIEGLPLSRVQQEKLARSLERPEALQRLCRRFEIARTIREASRDGLYDVSEHLADEAVMNLHERASYGKGKVSKE